MKKFYLEEVGTLVNVQSLITIEAENLEEAYTKYQSGQYEQEMDGGDFVSDNSCYTLKDFIKSVKGKDED